MLGLGTFFFFCFAGGFATSRILWMRGRGSGAIAAVVIRPPPPPPQQQQQQQQLGQLIPFTLISAARLPDKLSRLGETVLDKFWPINNRARDSRTIQGLFFFFLEKTTTDLGTCYATDLNIWYSVSSSYEGFACFDTTVFATVSDLSEKKKTTQSSFHHFWNKTCWPLGTNYAWYWLLAVILLLILYVLQVSRTYSDK